MLNLFIVADFVGSDDRIAVEFAVYPQTVVAHSGNEQGQVMANICTSNIQLNLAIKHVKGQTNFIRHRRIFIIVNIEI